MPSALFIDANLIVLLVVGLAGRELIAKHRRTKMFTVEDFDRLIRAISPVAELRVTPNTLTEASNLLGQHGEPQRSRLLLTLRTLIERSPEIVVASVDAARRDEFPRLGLTDAALLEVVSADAPLLTVDLDLYVAALASGEVAAINFNHWRGVVKDGNAAHGDKSSRLRTKLGLRSGVDGNPDASPAKTRHSRESGNPVQSKVLGFPLAPRFRGDDGE